MLEKDSIHTEKVAGTASGSDLAGGVLSPPLPTFTSSLWKMLMDSRVLQLNFLLVAALVLFVIVFEVTHLQFSGVDFDQRFVQYEQREAEHNRGHGGALACAADLWLTYIRAQTTKFVITVGLVFIMVGLIQYIQYLLVGWSNDFWARVQKWGEGKREEGDVDLFYALLTIFLLYAVSHVLADSYLDYILSMFQVMVWGSLTSRFAGRWLGGYAFYRMELEHNTDNPDQRIAEDTKNFVDGSCTLTTGFVSNAAQFIIFSVQVWQMSPDRIPWVGIKVHGWLLYASIVYAVAVTGLIHLLSWKMKVLDATQQGVEADMRFELMSVRHYSDTIALNRSERYHNLRILDAFEIVRRCTWENMFISKRYALVTRFFSQTEVLWAFAFLGPAFLSGDISLGQLMAANRAFEFLREAAMWFSDSYGVIQEWRASTERLMRFDESVARHMAAGRVTVKEDSDGLSLQKLSVWVPKHKDALRAEDGTSVKNEADDEYASDKEKSSQGEDIEKPLLSRFSFDSPTGGLRLLLRGPSGSGKTTLLRALAGAWPSAEGVIEVPGKLRDALFFPEKVCVPTGTLKAAVSYPIVPEEVEDQNVLDALGLVGLRELAANGLEAEEQWGITLSAGQKARLNLARLALHKPVLSALDEPTAHLEVGARTETLRAVLEALPSSCSIIVVSHDESKELSDLFNTRFSFNREGKTLSQL